MVDLQDNASIWGTLDTKRSRDFVRYWRSVSVGCTLRSGICVAAGVVPKPYETATTKRRLRNPLKGKNQDCLQQEQRKTWRPASHQAKPNQKVLGERLRKSRTAAGFVPKPCETATTKTAETLPTEPTKRKEKELPSATLIAFSNINLCATKDLEAC